MDPSAPSSFDAARDGEPGGEVDTWLRDRAWVARLARRLLGDGPDADDLAQDTLTRALARPRDVASRLEGARRGWLAAVARRLVLERRRSDAHRSAREAEAARPEAHDEEAALGRVRLQRQLLAAVLELPEPMRSAVVLRYFEQLTYEELATRIAVSPVAARKRVSRGIEALRDRLQRELGGEREWVLVLTPFLAPKRLGPSSVSPLAATRTAAPHLFLAMQTSTKLCVAVLLALLSLVALWATSQRGTGAAEEAIVADRTPHTGLSAESSQIESLRSTSSERLEVERLVASDVGPSGLPYEFAFVPRPVDTVGTLELRVRWNDGSPAAQVAARLLPWGAGNPQLVLRDVVTDAHGVAVVEQLAPGRCTAYVERGGGGTAEVVAGERVVLDVTLPRGFDARVRVMDPDGRRVAGAAVWLSSHGNSGEGAFAAMTDASGTASVRSVSGQHYVSARAAGFGPTPQVMLRGAEGATIEVELRLRGAGSSLQGTVRAPNGRPVLGARVRIQETTPASDASANAADGRWVVEDVLPVEVRTDEEGRFAAPELAAGEVEVQVRVETLALWTRILVLEPGTPHELDVQLAPGTSLKGRVLHADGTAAADASVTYGRFTFGSIEAICDENGDYELVGLSGATVEVQAGKKGHGSVREVVHLRHDGSDRWDPALGAPLLEVEGRVEDERGAPLAGWTVATTIDGSLWGTKASTGEDGSFRVPQHAPRFRALVVWAPTSGFSAPVLVLRDVLPHEGPLHIVVEDAHFPEASLSARVTADGGAAPPDTGVTLVRQGTFGRWERYPDASGSVVFEGLVAGDYELHVAPVGRAKLVVPLSLAPRERRELGQLDLPRGGRVKVVLSGPSEAVPRQVHFVDADGMPRGYLDLEGGAGTSALLPPGPVHLELGSHRSAAQRVSAEVVEGETITLTASVQPGTSRLVRVRRADGSIPSGDLTATATDAGGMVVMRTVSTEMPGSAPAPRSIRVAGLVIGRFKLLVETRDGARGELWFDVHDLAQPSSMSLEVVLE